MQTRFRQRSTTASATNCFDTRGVELPQVAALTAPRLLRRRAVGRDELLRLVRLMVTAARPLHCQMRMSHLTIDRTGVVPTQ